MPNSPVIFDGPLPSNFIPQTLTNPRCVSNPISCLTSLPNMGTHSGMGTPGNLPPMFPSSGPPAGQLYDNLLANNRDRDDQSQQQPPLASPAWGSKTFALGGASPAWANKQPGTPGGAELVHLLCHRGVHPHPLVGVPTTMRSEPQASAVAPVVAEAVAALPRLAGGAVQISHSYHPASPTVHGV